MRSFLGADDTNDYSRIAAQLSTTVPTAAMIGLLSSIVIPPLGIYLYYLGHKHEFWKDPVELPKWLQRRAA